MAVFECPSCHQQRSRGKHMPCNVCWLLSDLLDEHDNGEHDDRPAHGCGKCAPVLRSQIAAEARAVVRASDDAIRRSQARRHELSVLRPASRPSLVGQLDEHLQRSSPRIAGSHAQCEHESTRAARAKCRAARRKAGP